MLSPQELGLQINWIRQRIEDTNAAADEVDKAKLAAPPESAHLYEQRIKMLSDVIELFRLHEKEMRRKN